MGRRSVVANPRRGSTVDQLDVPRPLLGCTCLPVRPTDPAGASASRRAPCPPLHSKTMKRIKILMRWFLFLINQPPPAGHGDTCEWFWQERPIYPFLCTFLAQRFVEKDPRALTVLSPESAKAGQSRKCQGPALTGSCGGNLEGVSPCVGES